MSIWGEQWACSCGWENVTLRKRCRNCGKARPAEAPVKTPFEVMADVRANELEHDPKDFPLVPGAEIRS